tara:strand:+ start:109 stop:558 length:450 start_codon:yes stop_codon:yes gene_type:complete
MAGLSDFKTDKQAESDGRWVIFAGICKVLVRRAGSSHKRFQLAFTKATRPYRHAMENDNMDNDVVTKILASLYSDYIIVDWSTWVAADGDKEGCWQQGIELDGGEIVPITKETITERLIEIPEIFDLIREESTKASNYRVEAREADAEN